MDKVSKKILKLYAKQKTLSLFDIAKLSKIKPVDLAEPMLELIDKKLICKMLDFENYLNDNFDPDAQYYITQEGRSYLENIRADSFKFYFQIVIQLITTIIAVAAFIKSFFINI